MINQRSGKPRCFLHFFLILAVLLYCLAPFMKISAEEDDAATSDAEICEENEESEEGVEPIESEEVAEPDEPAQSETTDEPSQQAELEEPSSLPTPEQTHFEASLPGLAVHVETGDQAFTESVVFSVKVLDENDASFKSAEQQLLEQAGSTFDEMLAVEISFISQATGEEVEPQGDAHVEIKVQEDMLGDAAELDSVTVTHMNELSGGIRPEVVAEGNAKRQEDVIQIDFSVESFSVFTLSWSYSNSMNLHYGYLENGSFHEFPNGTPADGQNIARPTSSGQTVNLRREVEGYQYAGTYIDIATGTLIKPTLRSAASGYSYVWQYALAESTSYQNFASANQDLYVAFTEKPDDSGTPGGNSGTDLGEPEHHKTLTENIGPDGTWDGTYTLSLDITGKQLESYERSKADVIVVLDTSRSMTSDRMTTAKSALRSLATQLFESNLAEYPDTIRLSLITFSTNVNSASGFVQTYSDFNSILNDVASQGNGGTNWEAALIAANNMSVRSDADTYVIFVSDGNPTFHVTDGGYNNYNPRYGVYGSGTEENTNVTRSYNQAVDDARRIVQNGKTLYSVSVFGSIDRMQSLARYAYGGIDVDGHYQSAANQAELNQAFSNIVQEITRNYGYKDVVITDILSDLADTMDLSDSSAFRYYKNGAEWSGAPQATYNETNGVIWDLSTVGVLEPDVTYTIQFTVWPNQNAFDDITDILNGRAEYDPDQYPSLVQNEDGSLSAYSNASGKVTYRQVVTVDGVEQEGELKETGYERPTMTTKTAKMRIRKVWDEGSDTSQRPKNPDGTPAPIELTILRDGEAYMKVTLSEDNGWEQEIEIAPGLIATEVSSEPLASGYDYTVLEEGITPQYELIAETVHPMQTDGVITYGGDGDNVLLATNRLYPKMEIKKVDGNDETQQISGVTFQLTDVNTGDLVEKATDDDGTALFSYLKDGEYRLQEVVTAEGYTLPKDPWIVLVRDGVITVSGNDGATGTMTYEDGIYRITLKNYPIYVLPQAGSRGTFVFTISGFACMTTALLLLEKRRRGGEKRSADL